MPLTPEQITQKINETGYPLEVACAEMLEKIDSEYFLTVTTQVPYDLRMGEGEGYFGATDLIAHRDVSGQRILPIFIFEIKRADPGIKSWIFHKSWRPARLTTYCFTKGGHFFAKAHYPGININTTEYDDVADQWLEVSSSSASQTPETTDITRDPIYKAFRQLSCGMKGLLFGGYGESAKHIVAFKGAFEGSVEFKPIIPIVVTTADLYMAKTDPGRVDLKSGRQKEVESVAEDWILCSSAVPENLRVQSWYSEQVSVVPDKNFAFVVKAEKLLEFCQKLVSDGIRLS